MKREQGFGGVGGILKPQAISKRVSIKQRQDGSLNFMEGTALSFHEDCLHMSGQNTSLDIIYDVQGYVMVKISQVSRCNCNYGAGRRHQLLDWIALGLRVTQQSQQMLNHTGLAP